MADEHPISIDRAVGRLEEAMDRLHLALTTLTVKLGDLEGAIQGTLAKACAANDNAVPAAGRRSRERADWRDSVPSSPEGRAAARAAVSQRFARGR